MEQYWQSFLMHLESLLINISTHLTSFTTISLIIFLLLILISLKLNEKSENKKPTLTKIKPVYVPSSQDIQAVAGDNMITTQLDLARAYIEMDQKKLAKSMLQQVLRSGNADQRQEAKRLIEGL